MKNLIEILSLLTLVFFASCKKEDSKPSNSEFVGVWELVKMTCDNGKTITKNAGGTTTANFTIVGQDFNTTVVFTSDGLYTTVGSYIAVRANNFNNVQETSVNNFLWNNGTYEVKGSNFIATANFNRVSTAQIQSISNGIMKLKFVVNEVQTASWGTEKTLGTYYYTLEKQ